MNSLASFQLPSQSTELAQPHTTGAEQVLYTCSSQLQLQVPKPRQLSILLRLQQASLIPLAMPSVHSHRFSKIERNQFSCRSSSLITMETHSLTMLPSTTVKHLILPQLHSMAGRYLIMMVLPIFLLDSLMLTLRSQEISLSSTSLITAEQQAHHTTCMMALQLLTYLATWQMQQATMQLQL